VTRVLWIAKISQQMDGPCPMRQWHTDVWVDVHSISLITRLFAAHPQPNPTRPTTTPAVRSGSSTEGDPIRRTYWMETPCGSSRCHLLNLAESFDGWSRRDSGHRHLGAGGETAPYSVLPACNNAAHYLLWPGVHDAALLITYLQYHVTAGERGGPSNGIDPLSGNEPDVVREIDKEAAKRSHSPPNSRRQAVGSPLLAPENKTQTVCVWVWTCTCTCTDVCTNGM
jgi:hypothetical protein